MKRIVYFASILFLASTITSCQKEIQKDETTPSDKGGVTVNVVADGNLVSDDASKTAAVVDGKTTKFKWTEGDAITLYEYVDGALNDKKGSDPATISDDGYSATFTVKLTKEDPEGSNYVYTACYPTGAFTSTSKYDRYQIPNTQTLTADGNFDPAADIMFGKTEPRSSRVTDETNLEFSFKRLGTAVKLTLKGIEKDEAINNITITAPEKIAGYSEIDFKTGVVGNVAYDAVNSLKLNSGEEKIIASGNEDGDVFWFRCIEGTWKGGDKFTIVVDTDKAGYTKEITIPAGGLEFSTGGFTKLTIGSLTRTQKATTIYNKVTEAPGDWSGEYLLVYEKGASNAYIWTGVDVTNCYAEATITDNAITSLPTGAATLTIAAMDGGYSIKVNGGTNDGKYISGKSGSNTVVYGDTKAVNTIAYSVDEKAISITSNTSILRYNKADGNNRFRYFKSGQEPVQLYKLDDNKTLTGIELNTENVTKEFPVNGEFNHNGLVVTANYDNGKTADVSESANLTVTAPDMTTAGENKDVTVTYKEGEVEFSETYKINVIAGTISVESISLNKTELSIQIEKTETLVATITPETATNKGIIWSSDKTDIATVENGVVKGVAVGTATITATSEDNENISASCTVNVTPKVEVVEISLNNGFYGVTKGNNDKEQTKTTDGVTIVSGCTSSASSKTYYDTDHIRYYTDSYLKVSVEGTISEIVFTANGTWNGSINVDQGTYTNGTKTWTGSAAEVDFSFKAQNRIASIKVTFTPDGATRYDVSCATVEGGTLSANPSRAKAGESITLTATPTNEEYVFNNWTVTDENSNPVSVNNGVFTMPASNVTVSGTFTQKTYTIKRGTAEHGTFTINGKADDNQTAHKGDKISLAAEAESGYEHTGWTITKEQGGNVSAYNDNTTFTMPADNVTVTPVFTATASIPVYNSLAELVAAGKPSATETTVKVTLTNEVITDKASSYICVKSGNQEVKLYKSNVPSEWAVGGTVSGTLQCPWLLYNNTDWELKLNAWTELDYTAPLKPCSTPVISFNDGKASITSTEGATIKYAINKDENTQPELTSTYSGEFSVADGDVVWAQATKEGCLDSEVASKKYTAGGVTKTYQHVFSAKPETGDNITLSGVNWNISATNLGSYNSGNYAGVQFGTKSADGQITLTSPSSWSFTADGKTGTKIKEVRLWLNLGGTSVTPKVTIGGKNATSNGTVTKNTSAGKDWTKTSKVTFTPAAGGNAGVIVIDVTSVKAGYICAIEIDTEDCN